MSSSLQTPIDVDLPVVDVSQFPQEFDAEELNHLKYHHGLAAVKEAWEEYGLFLVVNHGIPTDLLQNVESTARQLFAMPAKIKDGATSSNPLNSYFRIPTDLLRNVQSAAREQYAMRAKVKDTATTSAPIDSYVHKNSYESLSIHNSDSIPEISDRIWPQRNPTFCEAIRNYIAQLQALTQRICKIILASLGLDAKAFYRSAFQSCHARLRISRYSCDAKSIEEEVLYPHTDLDSLTILYQDNVGGLQVRSKEDEWLNVKPVAYSFVVNIGDSLKAWTNGRYRSAVHRVVYKGWKDRISILYFVAFPEDQQIWAPVELVDDDHPRRYRPFTLTQFSKEYQNLKPKRPSYIDEYAGI